MKHYIFTEQIQFEFQSAVLFLIIGTCFFFVYIMIYSKNTEYFGSSFIFRSSELLYFIFSALYVGAVIDILCFSQIKPYMILAFLSGYLPAKAFS